MARKYYEADKIIECNTLPLEGRRRGSLYIRCLNAKGVLEILHCNPLTPLYVGSADDHGAFGCWYENGLIYGHLNYYGLTISKLRTIDDAKAVAWIKQAQRRCKSTTARTPDSLEDES